MDSQPVVRKSRLEIVVNETLDASVDVEIQLALVSRCH